MMEYLFYIAIIGVVVGIVLVALESIVSNLPEDGE